MEQKNQKHSSSSSSSSSDRKKIKTVDAHHALRRLAMQQTPFHSPTPNLKTHCIENYYLLLSAMEDNLVEFKGIFNNLAEVIMQYV